MGAARPHRADGGANACAAGLTDPAARPDARRAAGSWQPTLQAGSRHRFYVVDPASNLMMQYAPEAEAKACADLERLLKHSWIG